MYFSYVQINQCVCVFGFGSMISFNETFLVCLLETQVTVNASNIYPKDVEAPASGVEDMTRLAYLHEPGVLQNLQSRYDINEIYVSYSQVIASPSIYCFHVRLNPVYYQTYTGSILIAVNPFRRLPHLYSSHMMTQYKGASLGELSPHPFAVADAAYR